MEWQIKTFDELTARELYDILRMRSEIFVAEQKCAYVDVDGADFDAWQIFAYDGRALAASMRVLPKGAAFDTLAMGRVAVARGLRGRGLARKMMERAISFARDELREDSVTLAAQFYLTGFYRSLGFSEISAPYDDEGIAHVDMRLEFRG